MSFTPEIRNPLKRDGVSQEERLIETLDPAYAKVEERSVDDLKAFASTFSEAVQYFDLNDITQGDWAVFYEEQLDDENPQRALFVAFLRLLNFLKEHTNTLTQRHLDYYYREVLDFENLGARPSQLHLYVELAQNLEEQLLEQGELVEAGKDETGKDILFKLVRQMVVNTVDIESFRTVFREPDAFDNRTYSAPEANSQDGNGEELADDASGWNTFGQSQLVQDVTGNFNNRSSRTMNDARLGFAIASPMFRLEEGNRAIFLNMEFENNVSSAPPQILGGLRIHYSNEAEWIEIPTGQILLQRSGKFLNWTLSLQEEDASWDNYSTEVHEGNIDTIYPVLRFEFLHDPNDPEFFGYPHLKALNLQEYTIQTEVTGVRSLNVQNDYSPVDVTKPFFPFGAVPGVGDSLYIGHSEIFRHKLLLLQVIIDWKEVPDADLGNYYKEYDPTILPANNFNDEFTINVDWLENRNWLPVLQPNQQLFEADARNQHSLLVVPVLPGFERKTREQEIGTYDYSVPYGYLRLQMTGPDLPKFKAFGHLRYPLALTHASVGIEVQSPYSPEIISLTINYKTDIQTIKLEDTDPNRVERFFHLDVFGETEIHVDLQGGYQFPLVPQLDHEGYLYLGMNNVDAPQSASVLFQLAEGSGDVLLSKAQTGVVWQYLAGTQWLELDALRVSTDTSRNLLHTGLITFDLPSDVSTSHTLMPNGLVWLRALIETAAEGIDKVEGIHAQGTLVEFSDNDNDPNFLKKFLQPNSVEGLKLPNTSSRSVNQPYASFDGAPPEDHEGFYIRVSERLRHKDRAIMIYDYERLVMQEFDGIYKTKCINHTDDVTELQPGAVRVIVLPNLRNHHARNPFQPKVGKRKLLDIQEYVSERINPFIDLVVENPVYEQIRLSFKVGFHEGFDAGFYGKLLHTDIQKFLSPWAFEEGEDIIFGGKVYKSSILKFIEDQEYVDFVVEFTMFHIYCDTSLNIEWAERVALGTLTEVYGGHSIVRFEFADSFGRLLRTEVDVRFLAGLVTLLPGQTLEMFLENDLLNLFQTKDNNGEEVSLNYVITVLKTFHYIDDVINVKMYYALPEDFIMEDVDTAETKSEKAILVTAQKHRIGVVAGDDGCSGAVSIGIHWMVVDADFIVT
jgi:hypothetical protein